MLALLLAVAWVCTVAILLFRAIRQYRTYQAVHPAAQSAPGRLPAAAVIVPARNEAANIERCLGSLLSQDYPADRLRIIAVDDNSTDQTHDLARALAESDPRLTLLRGRRLADGWAGKPYACWQGATSADGAEWLCFIDADTTAHPALIRTAIQTATARHLDMLSLEPFQELGSPWERLVIPAGFLMAAFTQDLRRVNDPSAPEAVANGQFILIRRDVYDALGGHSSVSCEICEDSALARRVKRAGYRLGVMGAETLIQTRMYHGFSDLWEGLSKNAIEMIGGAAATLAVVAAGLTIAWASLALPAWTSFTLAHHPLRDTSIVALALAALGSLALYGTHIGAARYFRIPLWYGLLFPVGYTVGSMIAINSVIRRLRGCVVWKGRAYTPPDRALSS